MTLLGVIAIAFVFGLATSVSPCPLTTNIAAISFLGRNVGNSWRVLLSALLYAAGRTVVYVALGTAILMAFQLLTGGQGDLQEFIDTNPQSRYLQRYINLVLGPVMLLVGLIFTGLVELNLSISVGGGASRLQERASRGSAFWALPLGMLFALAFCPPSILWFGSALVAAHDVSSPVLPPLAYGIGTAVPVIGFAFVIAFGGQYLGKAFNRLTQFERWFRLAAGAIFIGAGLYYILKYIYEVSIIPGA